MAEELVTELVGPDRVEAVVELVPYFREAFGNATRIDYGSGMSCSGKAQPSSRESLSLSLTLW